MTKTAFAHARFSPGYMCSGASHIFPMHTDTVPIALKHHCAISTSIQTYLSMCQTLCWLWTLSLLYAPSSSLYTVSFVASFFVSAHLSLGISPADEFTMHRRQAWLFLWLFVSFKLSTSLGFSLFPRLWVSRSCSTTSLDFPYNLYSHWHRLMSHLRFLALLKLSLPLIFVFPLTKHCYLLFQWCIDGVCMPDNESPSTLGEFTFNRRMERYLGR